MVLSLVIQLICSFIFSVIASGVKVVGLMQEGITNQAEMQALAQEYVMENIIWAVVLYQVVALVVFSLWYYFGCGRPKAAKVTSVMTPKTVSGTVILGVGIEFFVCTGVYLAGHIFPDLVGDFYELMNNAGMSGITVGNVIGAVILAPIGEEILCRGLTLYYAKKVTGKFMIANCIQALAFGIMHFNWVQGAYAFIIGLILGILYERFGSLYLCILAHFVINASSTFIVDPVMSALPDTTVTAAAVMAVGLIVCLAGLKLVGKPVKAEETVREAAV